VERGVAEHDDVMLSVIIIMNAPMAVGSSALLGHGIIITQKSSANKSAEKSKCFPHSSTRGLAKL
jgi:hypothetical protein